MRLSERLKAFFPDASDQEFLEHMFSLKKLYPNQPDIGEKFDKYLKIDPEEREQAAIEDLKHLPRTGLVMRGISDGESVFTHSMRLMEVVYKNRGGLNLSTKQRIHMQRLAKVHDLPEAIVGDFPPGILDGADKKRLEHLAAILLFEGLPESMKLYKEYEAKETRESQLLSDLDKIDACRVALAHETLSPKQMKDGFVSHVNTAREKLKTKEGHLMLDALIEQEPDWRDKIKNRANPPHSELMRDRAQSIISRN